MIKVDLIIKNIMIVTVNEKRELINNGLVAIKGQKFVAVGKTEELETKYEADKVIDGEGKALFPGFISLHSHLFQNSLKGLGRDKSLFDWLDASVRKAYGFIDYNLILAAATAGCLENLNTGATTILDYQYCHAHEMGLDNAVVEAFKRTGIRGILGRGHTKVVNYPGLPPCPIDETEDMFFADVDRLLDELKDEERISLALAPGIIWDLSEEGFKKCAEYSEKYNMNVTMHTLESGDDDAFSIEKYGKTTMEFLESTGVLSNRFIAVHCVQMNESDFNIFKKHELNVCHCPMSNMILGSGFAPVPRMIKEGLNVGLGADGSASSDTQSYLEQLKAASLVHKGNLKDPTVMPAELVIEMATINGAKALGLSDKIGSIEVGKLADCFIFTPHTLSSCPVADPIAAIVYSSEPDNIETVIVGGEIVKENNILIKWSKDDAIKDLVERAKDLRETVSLEETKWGQISSL
ncbi:MAG: amidohydrolase [Firmicutes bacterium]|nr:amidohydrolase [Bacillota bacterium]